MSEPTPRAFPEWRWSALSLGSVIGLVALCWLTWRLREVFLVLIAAVFLAYVLDPPVRLLARIPLARASSSFMWAHLREIRTEPNHGCPQGADLAQVRPHKG